MNWTHKTLCEIWLARILGLAPIWIDQIDFVRILDDEDIYRRWLSGCDDDSNLSYRNSPVPFKVGPQEKVLPSGEGALFMSRLKSYKEEETKAEGRGRRRRRGGEAAAEVFSILSLSPPSSCSASTFLSIYRSIRLLFRRIASSTKRYWYPMNLSVRPRQFPIT